MFPEIPVIFWTEAVNSDNRRDPVGVWSFGGSQEVYEPIKGEEVKFMISVKLSYHFSTTGGGYGKTI